MSLFSHRRVVATADYARIKDLPVREWGEDKLQWIADELTKRLKTPDGTQTLRPKQALALHDFGTEGGLIGSIRVGGGKTLITLLLPVMCDPAPRLALLVLPAALIEKTEADIQRYAKHWKIARNLKIVSYEFLGRIGAENFLRMYHPEVIILDEAHRAKNKRAGVTRRIARYIAENPRTKCAVLSGTLFKKSLRNAAHLMRWALKGKAPVPEHEGEVDEWADALDPDIQPHRRVQPGPLLHLVERPPEGSDDLVRARNAYRLRLSCTPGFVETTGNLVACSLNIRARYYDEDETTNGHFQTLREHWRTPDGWTESEAVAIWRHARELALGFHAIWDPRPPMEWVDARSAYAKFARSVLSRSRTLDTEKQVRLAILSGDIQSDTLAAWEKIAPSFTPNPVDVWHDTSALEFCEKWIKENPAGLIWVQHVFFAIELSRRTGIPYYGADGKTADGKSIVDMESSPLAGKVPLILSVDANKEGRNLQAWNTNLITTGLDADTLEQLIGRTHRDGQEADEVQVDMLMGCYEHFSAWQKALVRAQASLDTYGADQKILIATVDMPTEVDMLRRQGARWTKTVQKKDLLSDLTLLLQ